MRKSSYKSQVGSISMFVMMAMAFLLVTIVGVYMISAKRAQTQTESLNIVQGKYYTEGEENEKYSSKIAESNEMIPIYTKEQLWSIGENKSVEIEGKIYDFSNTNLTQYELKNDIIINIDTDLKNSKFKDNYIYGNNTINKNNFGVYYYYNGNYYVPVQYSDGTTTNNLCSDTPVLSASGIDFSNISTVVSGLSGEYYLFAYQNLSEDLGYVTDGLMLHYDGIKNTATGHDSQATVWKDLSGNGNDGTLNGCTWENNNLSFDGVDDGVDMTNLLKGNERFTIEYVSSQKRYKSYEYLWGLKGNYFGMESGASQYRVFYYGDNPLNGYNSRVALNDIMGNLDEVLHNTITVNVNVLNAYKNGEKKITNYIFENPLYLNGTKFQLGADGENNYRTQIDYYSFRIYNRALTDSEVQQNYETDKTRFGIE